MTVTDYYNSSMDDCMACIAGYEDRKNDGWKYVRSLEYAIYCVVTEPAKRVPMSAYMPLNDDPTPAEMAAAKEAEARAKAARFQQRIDDDVKRSQQKAV